jgi:hypothetical protein
MQYGFGNIVVCAVFHSEGCLILICVKAHQQRAVIEILTHENETPIKIHQQLLALCEDTVDKSG